MHIELEPREGFTFTATIEHDSDHGAPWEESDCHGPVSDWRRKSDKAPGELILCDDNRTGFRYDTRCRFYDFQEACRIALKDQWGVPAYRLEIEQGANGLRRANAQWFQGRELLSFVSDWCDDINDASRQVYASHRATFPSARAYAAAAARADFERLRSWCDGDWHWCGIVVTAYRNGIELGSASLWGIESDSGAYIEETARELCEEAMEEAREALASLCDCEEA